jgi:hypothetical protein
VTRHLVLLAVSILPSSAWAGPSALVLVPGPCQPSLDDQEVARRIALESGEKVVSQSDPTATIVVAWSEEPCDAGSTLRAVVRRVSGETIAGPVALELGNPVMKFHARVLGLWVAEVLRDAGLQPELPPPPSLVLSPATPHGSLSSPTSLRNEALRFGAEAMVRTVPSTSTTMIGGLVLLGIPVTSLAAVADLSLQIDASLSSGSERQVPFWEVGAGISLLLSFSISRISLEMGPRVEIFYAWLNKTDSTVFMDTKTPVPGIGGLARANLHLGRFSLMAEIEVAATPFPITGRRQVSIDVDPSADPSLLIAKDASITGRLGVTFE